MQFTQSEHTFFQKFEISLEEVLSFGDTELSSVVLEQVSKYLCLGASPKRVRPLLTYYFSNMLKLPEETAIQIAMASELIHSASLLHDDVIDEADTRRGKMSANRKFSNAHSVLAGNFLISKAFRVLESFDKIILSQAIGVIEEMTKAAIIELEIRGNLDCGLKVWHKMAAGKTGALFGWSGRALGFIGGDLESAERFKKIGYHIGMAFQLADDAKDFSDKRGLKPRFADIRNREPSYPILRAASDSQVFRADCSGAWACRDMLEDDINRLGNYLLNGNAVPGCIGKIEGETAAAIDLLGVYSKTESGARLIEWLSVLRDSTMDGHMLGDGAVV